MQYGFIACIFDLYVALVSILNKNDIDIFSRTYNIRYVLLYYVNGMQFGVMLYTLKTHWKFIGLIETIGRTKMILQNKIQRKKREKII